MTDLLQRNNVHVSGLGGRDIVFSHGYGADQTAWRRVAPAFERDHRVILFDHVGCGGAASGAGDAEKYSHLRGYAADLREICDALSVRDAVYVGHSVAGMLGVLAGNEAPHLFSRLAMIGASPRYLNDAGYTGGFTREDIESLLDMIDTNYLGWSSSMAPALIADPDRPDLAEELARTLARADPESARRFARATFFADCREDLAKVTQPALLLQCKNDVIVPLPAAEYLRDHLERCTLRILGAAGHFPQLSAPAEVIAEIRQFL